MRDTITIETSTRWDALALARRLPPDVHWYLVQLTPRRWNVCVVGERRRRRRLESQVLASVEACVSERGAAALVHLAGGDRRVAAGSR